jgi:hypothetical protein
MLIFCDLGVQVRKEREKARLRAEGEKKKKICEYFSSAIMSNRACSTNKF